MRSDPDLRPSPADLRAAANKTVPDLIAPGLKILFCGINPGLYTAAVGHHFARPGNRFWTALYASGLTPRLFRPDEERQLLDLGYGITNLVRRATAAADELTADELRQGARALTERLNTYRPECAAFIGSGAYRVAFNRPKAPLGLQPDLIGSTALWVLPSTSGLNAHYTPAALADLFGELREAFG